MVLLLVLGPLACAPAQPDPGPGPPFTIRLSRPDDPATAFEVVGPSTLRLSDPARGDLDRALSVSVASRKNNPSPMLGTCRVEGDVLRFQPRFPLERGLRYRATFDPSALGSRGPAIEAEFLLSRPPASATARVLQVFPTRTAIPENQLKLYVRFSAPMSRGGIYEHIHLFDDATDRPVDLPFLEIDQELWDRSGKRLTLLFDPGRIKSGLKPREEAGPILRAGRSYTLVIDREWPDAEGNPLREPFRKTYSAGPADTAPIDPSAWTIQAPGVSSREPLRVTFPEPLDRALLDRALTVLDANGKAVPGAVAIEAEETAWRLAPERPWQAGDYRIVIDKDLEDLAGNQVGRAFEVDVFQTIERAARTETAELRFRVTP